MGLDRIEQDFVGKARVAEAEFGEGRALFAQDVPGGQPGAIEKLLQQRPARRRLQILDDVRLDAGIADQRERVSEVPQAGLW